jgi:formylglycine-generating enzyme required for sulfatase activity
MFFGKGETLNDGRYQVEAILGAGGFGITYRARQTRTQQQVAIKTLNRNQAKVRSNFKTLQERFINEAVALAQCQHPNVVKVYPQGFFQDDLWCIVMEYIEGQTLRDRVEEKGSLSETEAITLAQKLGNALRVVHEQGFLHRDLKPENILLRENDLKQPVLIDFGLARAFSEKRLHSFSTMSGTLGYAPIEQVEGRQEAYGPWTDIYGLAATIYCLVTNASPLAAQYRKLVPTEFKPPQEHQPDLSDHFNQGVVWGMELEPEERPQSIAEWLAWFAPVKEETPTSNEVREEEARNPESSNQEVSREEQDALPRTEISDMETLPPVMRFEEEDNSGPTILGETPSPIKEPPPKKVDSLPEKQKRNSSAPRKEAKINKPALMSRRRLMQVVSWGAVGLGGALVGQWFFRETPSPPPPKPPTAFTFEVVTVNATGAIKQRETRTAQQIVEELGNGVSLEMVEIPSGRFLMGAPETEEGSEDDERPQHQVEVPSFLMGKYPITQAQYQAIMGNNPSHFKGADHPVEMVNWRQAEEFCKRLSNQTGREYRLPSEAEWEYACRAGTTTPFYFGETITSDFANYDGQHDYGQGAEGIFREETTAVGSFYSNAFGLYDMHGNVWEWCQDLWHENYRGAPSDGGAWVSGKNNNFRVLRGGSWYDVARSCRCAERLKYESVRKYKTVGLRVVSSANLS